MALGDRNYDQAAAIAQKFEVFADAEEMLCCETIDFVDVAAAPEPTRN
jgi:predicted dehydrogenase